MKLLNAKQGFTLVELMVYFGLLAIFLLVLTDIFVAILNVRTESEATSPVEQDGRFILSRLSYDINRATQVTTPASFGAPGTNSLQITIGGISYTYSIVGSSLQLTNDFSPSSINSSETTVSAVNFQKIGNASGKPTIKISFTIDSKTQRNRGPESRIFNTTVGLR